MARLITSANTADYHNLLAASVESYGVNGDVEMKVMEEESASTVDSSTLIQPSFSAPEYHMNSMAASHVSNVVRPVSKGKAVKKIKNDDAEDEEIDIDKCVNDDCNRVSVKILRKVIPKLRIACYYSDEQVSGKRKLKHLWDEKPSDWPSDIPFKDPNNAIKDTKKPGKDELAPMYEFLRKRYLEKKSHLEVNNIAMTYSTTTASHQESAYQNMAAAVYSLSNAQATDDSLGTAYVNSPFGTISVNAVEDSKDSKNWNISASQQWFQHAVKQPLPSFPDEDQNNTLLAPTGSEHIARNIHHMASAVTMSKSVHGSWENQTSEPPRLANIAPLPSPVKDLYTRLQLKQEEVLALAGHNSDVKSLLADVQKDVIDCLYSKLTCDETRLCLMFIDAGHQYEALLDVMVVLSKVDRDLLNSGCQEIIKKFTKECPTLMALFGKFGIYEPRATCDGMISIAVKSAVYGISAPVLEALPNGNALMFPSLPAEEEKSKLLEADENFSQLGIVKRVSAPELNAQLDIRTTDETELEMQDDGKKGIDSELEEILKEFLDHKPDDQTEMMNAIACSPAVELQETVTTVDTVSTLMASPSTDQAERSKEASLGDELMDFLDDVDYVISKDRASEATSCDSHWDDSVSSTSSWNGASLGSGTWTPSAVNKPESFSFSSFPVVPMQQPTGAESSFTMNRMAPVYEVQQHSIPLCVSNASVDDFDDMDQSNRRRRSRQSRASVSGRGVYGARN